MADLPQLHSSAAPHTWHPCCNRGYAPQFEFLLNDVVDGEWFYGPEPSIRLPLERVFVRSPLGPLVTVPEILLLHKAWYTHHPKDNHDFERVRDLLDAPQRGWLRAHLKRIRPDDPWLSQLMCLGPGRS